MIRRHVSHAMVGVLVFTVLFSFAMADSKTHAAGPVQAGRPALSTEQKADVARVQNYLTAFKSITANFLQIAPNGGEATGKLYIKRPGRLRFEYDPPVPILIVADGTWFIYYDRDMLNATYISLDSTPAWFLVSDDLELGGDITVTDVARGPAALRITLIKTREPESGSLTLIFADDPLELKQWLIVDPQGQKTRISLHDWKAGADLPADLFIFNEPTSERESPQ